MITQDIQDIFMVLEEEEYFPGWHFLQLVDPLLEDVLSMQSKHFEKSENEYAPPGQILYIHK